VLHQAEIAYDLLQMGVGLRGTAAGLWLVGFPVPLKPIREAFEKQVADHFRRGQGRSRDDLEEALWQHVQRFVRADARARGGSADDAEGIALGDLSGQLLELLCGVGDSGPEVVRLRQWSSDVAAEVISQLEALRPLVERSDEYVLPDVHAPTVEDIAVWFWETGSLLRQREALRIACPHDWIRARRLAGVAIGLLDRAFTTASPKQVAMNRQLFTRLAIGWGRLVFPTLLAVVRNPDQRRFATGALMSAARIVRKKRLGEAQSRGEQLIRT
jgi:hypothetical protein